MARTPRRGITLLMTDRIRLDKPLSWRQIAAIAAGATPALEPAARERIAAARRRVESIVARGIRAYGVNTGVGALCEVIVTESKQRQLSRNIVMSTAVGVGAPLEAAAVRAIMAAAVNNFAHGFSGVRPQAVDLLIELLAQGCIPEVPEGGSVGYLSHMAHVALVLIGSGHARLRGERHAGDAALSALGLQPLQLEAKEGLSLVNGTPCVTGLCALALARAQHLLGWADVIGAMTFENLHGQISAFDAEGLNLRASPALQRVGERLRAILAGSGILADSAGRRTQDALSLRAIPHVHGAVYEQFEHAAAAVDTELASATDNPLVLGSVEAPRSFSAAHAVGAGIGLAADSLGIAMAELAAMSERRIDRLVNPLVSRLPAFLAPDGGVDSGFMMAQYTALSLSAENRRLAAPASLDGGVTSGLQEDHLCHATPAALKLLKIVANAEMIFSIELLAAAQAYDLQPGSLARAPKTDRVYRRLREKVAKYQDDRPLNEDFERALAWLRGARAEDI
jgi:histidine ammonia-lyase